MFEGRLIAESCKPGTRIQVADLRLSSFSRHDVGMSTVPADERDGTEPPGVAEGQPRVWTFVDFEGPDDIADEFARALADALEPDFGWLADFRIDGSEHVVVFAGKVFRYRVGDDAARDEAIAWGRAHGTPEAQLDWRR